MLIGMIPKKRFLLIKIYPLQIFKKPKCIILPFTTINTCIMKKMIVSLMALSFLVAVSSCRETTGEKVEEAAEAVGEDIENAAEATAETVEEGIEEIDREIDEARVDDMVEDQGDHEGHGH